MICAKMLKKGHEAIKLKFGWMGWHYKVNVQCICAY
jgi:hypothetical protein